MELFSFVFLKREVPVRLANIMKELMLMPVELRRTRACSTVVGQYAQSFQVRTSVINLKQGILKLRTRKNYEKTPVG